MDLMLLLPICEQEIKRELETLDPSKSCGHDNIMPRVVKLLASELSVPLSYIIVVYDGNRNRNNKEMSENVFSRESNPGLLVTGQMPYYYLL